MFRISKRFDFSASHVLEGLPDDHPCSRLHGHNYSVTVELSADRLDDVGFVIDYRGLAKFKAYIDDQLDHRHLNERLVMNPTAENLAMILHGLASSLFDDDRVTVTAVVVNETPKTSARFEP